MAPAHLPRDFPSIMFRCFLLFFAACFLPSCQNDPIKPPARGPKFVLFRGPSVPLLSNRINQIVAHRNSQIWIATDSGAAYYDRGSWGVINDSLKYWQYGSGVPPWQTSRVNCITVGKDGSVWFGLGGGGIRRFMPTSTDAGRLWVTYQIPEISFNTISSLACDEFVNGDVWAGTLGAGLNRFMPSVGNPRYGQWRVYTAANVPGFRSNFIQTTAVNLTNQSVWVSTPFSLLAFINDVSGWSSFDIPHPYDSQVFSIAFDLAGRVWLGKADGVSVFNSVDGSWTHHTSQNTGGMLPEGRLFSVLTDLHTLRWFGTTEGLLQLNDTTWTLFDASVFSEWPGDTVTALTYDRAGNLWIGTTNGVVVYNESGTIL